MSQYKINLMPIRQEETTMNNQTKENATILVADAPKGVVLSKGYAIQNVEDKYDDYNYIVWLQIRENNTPDHLVKKSVLLNILARFTREVIESGHPRINEGAIWRINVNSKETETPGYQGEETQFMYRYLAEFLGAGVTAVSNTTDTLEFDQALNNKVYKPQVKSEKPYINWKKVNDRSSAIQVSKAIAYALKCKLNDSNVDNAKAYVDCLISDAFHNGMKFNDVSLLYALNGVVKENTEFPTPIRDVILKDIKKRLNASLNVMMGRNLSRDGSEIDIEVYIPMCLHALNYTVNDIERHVLDDDISTLTDRLLTIESWVDAYVM